MRPVPARTCEVPGCVKLGRRRMCQSHEWRLRVKGDVMADVPLGALPRHRVKPTAGRFWAKVRSIVPGECWEWTHATDGHGYGAFWDRERIIKAYRWAYQDANGPVPEGLQLDHLCRNKICVNPAHLEPVTMRENLRRGKRPYSGKTHCIHGHELTPENTKINSRGNRECATCQSRRGRRQYEAKKAVQGAFWKVGMR